MFVGELDIGEALVTHRLQSLPNADCRAQGRIASQSVIMSGQDDDDADGVQAIRVDARSA